VVLLFLKDWIGVHMLFFLHIFRPVFLFKKNHKLSCSSMTIWFLSSKKVFIREKTVPKEKCINYMLLQIMPFLAFVVYIFYFIDISIIVLHYYEYIGVGDRHTI
jgi:hypothetical protein